MKRYLQSAAATAALMTTTIGGAQLSAQEGQPTSFVPVEQALIETIDRQLPERQAVGSAFLDEAYYPKLSLSGDAQISTTFVSEGAGYRNAIGYYAYQDGAFDGLTFGDIDVNGSGIISTSEIGAVAGVTDTGLLFSNFSGAGSGGNLVAGDSLVIGGGTLDIGDDGSINMMDGTVFSEGTNVGFWLSANAWNGSGVNGWNNGRDPATYYSDDFLNPENTSDATVGDVSRGTRHLAMLNVSDADQVIVGFEDLNRATGDNDFNDAVFIVRADPIEAIDGSPIPEISAAPTPALNLLGVLALLATGGFYRRRQPKAA